MIQWSDSSEDFFVNWGLLSVYSYSLWKQGYGRFLLGSPGETGEESSICPRNSQTLISWIPYSSCFPHVYPCESSFTIHFSANAWLAGAAEREAVAAEDKKLSAGFLQRSCFFMFRRDHIFMIFHDSCTATRKSNHPYGELWWFCQLLLITACPQDSDETDPGMCDARWLLWLWRLKVVPTDGYPGSAWQQWSKQLTGHFSKAGTATGDAQTHCRGAPFWGVEVRYSWWFWQTVFSFNPIRKNCGYMGILNLQHCFSFRGWTDGWMLGLPDSPRTNHEPAIEGW